MGAPVSDMNAADDGTAEALLTSLKTIDPAERRKHASVLNYWLSIRGKRQLPPIRDLDPLEISDAGPFSALLEMIGGGEDAEIRHLGQAIKDGVEASRISDVPGPSLLACIHAKLTTVAARGQALAFEDSFTTGDGTRRCWVTLLPFSASEAWIDYVYAFVSLDGASGASGETADAPVEEPETAQSGGQEADGTPDPFRFELRPYGSEADTIEQLPETVPASESYDETLDPPPAEHSPRDLGETFEPEPMPEPEFVPEPVSELKSGPETVPELKSGPETVPEPEFEPEPDHRRSTKPGFSTKLLDGLASVGGFYGKVSQSVPTMQIAIGEEQETAQTGFELEGSLQDKLSGVRAVAEEARQTQERSWILLYQGLGAAYDFALDAEAEPEDYLKLVESQGLKIQLRSPMAPVVKLAFAGLCDDETIAQLEAVFAWALKINLPRGSLPEKIQAAGGIEQILAERSS